MGEYIVQLLKEKNQKALLKQDSIYEKSQKKNLDVQEGYAMLWSKKIKRMKVWDNGVSVEVSEANSAPRCRD